MKKLFALCIAVAMVSFMACGGGKNKEAEAKRIADSARVADSIAQVKADSATKAEAEQMKMDSIAKAAKEDSIKKAEKKGKK